MSKKKALRARHIELAWAALLFALLVLLMAVLKCEMATPAY